MRRRVVEALRIVLCTVGAIVLVWIPFSFFCALGLQSGILLSVRVHDGRIEVEAAKALPRKWPEVSAWWWDNSDWRMRFLPSWGSIDLFPGYYYLILPLWLLAVICLAWPVTSFILARRRRNGRGFEVKARPGRVPPAHRAARP